MCTRGLGVFLCAPCSSPPISHVSLHSHPGARVLCHTSNQRGLICTRCSVLGVLSTLCPPQTHPAEHRHLQKRCIYRFSFSFFLLFNLADFTLKLSPKTTKEQTCRVMRVSVNHGSQQHCLMQEATGVGSLQSRECLLFDYRTTSEE